jgi:predicted PurR-regulated permease PerM
MNINTENKKIIFDLSSHSFFKLIAIVLLLVFLYLVRDLLLMIFVAIVIASGIDPLIDFFQKRRIPRSISLLVVYIFLLAVVTLIIYVLVPPIIDQVQQLVSILPQYFQVVSDYLGENFVSVGGELGNIEELTKSLTGRFGDIATNLYSTISNFFGGIFTLVIILVLSFYFTVEENNFKQFIKSITPTKHRPYLEDLVERIQRQIGLWLRGQLTLGLIVGILIFIGLTILDVKYALILALLAAIFEIVPYIGPIIAAIPAVFLAFTQSPVTGLLVIGLYLIVQQLENHIIVPKVMGKTVGLNPLVIILVILVGSKIAGIMGAILAVPIATALQVFLKDLFEIKDAREVAKLQKQMCPVMKIEEEGLTEKEIEQRRKLQGMICPITKKPKIGKE